jgi:hypothetical protein
MARVSSAKGRGKKAAAKNKRKVAVSRKTHPPQRGTSDNTPLRVANMPPFQDTSNLDVANEIARRHRNQIAAQQPASPDFPGNIPPQQFASALLAGEGSLTAEAAIIAHKEMLARLAELEATVAKLLSPSTPGIGHNNPPPLDNTELEEIKREIALLKAQPPVPTALPVEASKTASKFVRLGQRVLTWIGKHLDTGIAEFMKSAGKTAGPVVVGGLLAIWLTVGHQLTDSAIAIMQWLMRLLGQ